MRITVHNEAVRQNIDLFKKLVERHRAKEQQEAAVQLVAFSAFVNPLTGDLDFVEKEAHPKHKGWKQICMRLKKEGHECSFEILEDEKNNLVFQWSDLQPLARRVMAETILVLNNLAHTFSHQGKIEEFLKELVRLEIEGKDLMHEAWHQVDRMGAEKLLKNKEIGTFLFRKDEYAGILETQLKEKHPHVKCFTLTYVADKKKISDCTMVYHDGRWLFYNDDPNLGGRSYETVLDLLGSIKGELTEPLLSS